jgi:hypothetical protein
VFSHQEAETLISHPEIPFDRRMVYALGLLAGLRTGEAAALRWRHYYPDNEPLGELVVAFAYSTRKACEKRTKTEVVKHVPVHPTLAAMLAEWKLGGWAEMMERPPEPDDLIVPLPPETVARQRNPGSEPFRGYRYSGHYWDRVDLPMLGWRHRRHYDTRATFITLAVADGADPHLIETRVTHTKKSHSAFAGYHRAILNRGPEWARICAEVVKLKISRRPQERGAVLLLPLAAAAAGGGAGGGLAGGAGGAAAGGAAAGRGAAGGGAAGPVGAGGDAAGADDAGAGAIVELTDAAGRAGGAIVELTGAARAGLRNSGRYSAAKVQGSHAKIIAKAHDHGASRRRATAELPRRPLPPQRLPAPRHR